MAETAVMAPYAGGAAPAAQLARVWLTALTVSGDERPADPDGIPMDIADRADLSQHRSPPRSSPSCSAARSGRGRPPPSGTRS